MSAAKKNAEYDAVPALIGYDRDGSLRIAEADGWWEQAITWAADPIRVLIQMPILARPEHRPKKQALLITLSGPKLFEPSAL